MRERKQMKGKSREVLCGVYQHYKGEYYLVLGLAAHSETKEQFIVYVPLYAREGPRMFIRPEKMFFEKIEIDGKKQPRFNYIGSEIPS